MGSAKAELTPIRGVSWDDIVSLVLLGAKTTNDINHHTRKLNTDVREAQDQLAKQ